MRLSRFIPMTKALGARRWMLKVRIHFLQHWLNLSDHSIEEVLYDSRAMRRFVGIDLGAEPVPDDTTICKFHHLLERHDLGARLFVSMGKYQDENALKVNRGTIADATIINARRARRTTKTSCVIRRCVRRARVINGILG